MLGQFGNRSNMAHAVKIGWAVEASWHGCKGDVPQSTHCCDRMCLDQRRADGGVNDK
jgi:hypothetical protein